MGVLVQQVSPPVSIKELSTPTVLERTCMMLCVFCPAMFLKQTANEVSREDDKRIEVIADGLMSAIRISRLIGVDFGDTRTNKDWTCPAELGQDRHCQPLVLELSSSSMWAIASFKPNQEMIQQPREATSIFCNSSL